MLYREMVSSATGHHAAFAAGGLVNYAGELAEQCKPLRCIVGFLPIETRTIPLAWLNSNVVTLARKIHDTKSFELLPRLTAELEQAGCDDKEILTHCRSSDLHVHGCWVIDTLLGGQ